MLTKLNKEEELKVVTMLLEKREDFIVSHYKTMFFGMELEVCDITTFDDEIEKEIFYAIFPQFD